MAKSVLIVAESGCGKSASIRTLNPKETFIINVSGKELPFPGWSKNYKLWTKDNPSGNLYIDHKPANILAGMNYVNTKRPEITNLVIDDFQFMSAFEFFDRISEKGFDKYNDIGGHAISILRNIATMRNNLTVFILTHVEEGTDVEGKKIYRAKTIGKLMHEKATIEGFFRVVLFAKVKKNPEGGVRYVFETNNNGDNTCKSPMGMFDSFEIENSLQIVKEAISKYDLEESSSNVTPASKLVEA